MLLTTANFVTRRRDTKDCSALAKGCSTEVTKKLPSDEPTTECALKPKTGPDFFQFPDVKRNYCDSLCTSGYGSLENCSTSLRAASVAIETDGYYLSVDPFFYNVTLKKCLTPCLPESCCFRMAILQQEITEKGNTQTVVFYLRDNDQYFLNTTVDKQLEINMYNSDIPELGNPDERFFTVFTTLSGQILIQPHAHKGHYFHHLDDKLSVRKLDLNWRAPEEYFFSISEMIFDIPLKKSRLRQTNMEETRAASNQARNRPEVAIAKTNLSEGKQKKKLAMKDLFFGCFGGRSRAVAYQH